MEDCTGHHELGHHHHHCRLRCSGGGVIDQLKRQFGSISMRWFSISLSVSLAPSAAVDSRSRRKFNDIWLPSAEAQKGFVEKKGEREEKRRRGRRGFATLEAGDEGSEGDAGWGRATPERRNVATTDRVEDRRLGSTKAKRFHPFLLALPISISLQIWWGRRGSATLEVRDEGSEGDAGWGRATPERCSVATTDRVEDRRLGSTKAKRSKWCGYSLYCS